MVIKNDSRYNPGVLPIRALGILAPVSFAAAALILLPIFAVLASLLAPATEVWTHLAETALLSYVLNTGLLAIGVAFGVVSIGVLSAWLVSAYEFPGRRVLEWMLVLPFAMPAFVTAYAYTDWLQFSGPVQTALRHATGWQSREYWFPEIRSLPGAVAVLSFALYPYVYLLARAAFADTSRAALEAGRLAGCGAWASFFRIALPIARPAIVAGTALALMETLADFGTVSYFALEVFTTGIFKAWLSFGDPRAAAQLSACLLGLVALVLALERASRGRASYAAPARRPLPPQPLAGARAALAFAACAAPVVAGFLLPAVLLVHLALGDPAARPGPRLAALVANSFTLAAFAAAIGVALAVTMAYAARLARGRAAVAVTLANRTASLGYAVPGAVIAVGILVPVARLDHWLADLVEAASGAKSGLFLTGTAAALVYAYLVRFLAVALQTVEAGLAAVTARMDDAARSLGASPGRVLARVHAPLLAPSLGAAALLLFVDVLKELPATFALRPFDFDTLAIEIYHLAKDERLAEAAVPSLVLVAVSVLPLVVLTRRALRGVRR